jgi:hypothetical protein
MSESLSFHEHDFSFFPDQKGKKENLVKIPNKTNLAIDAWLLRSFLSQRMFLFAGSEEKMVSFYV